MNTNFKVNFIIVGSAKCGTSTLADVLSSHPDCCFSNDKEVKFFSHDDNFNKGISWYHTYFQHYQGEKISGEATPNYSHEPKHAKCAERIFQYNPECKIIYIVRHPYKKLISNWKMDYKPNRYRAQEGFEAWFEVMNSREHYVLDTCRFAYQLSFYQSLFRQEQILTLFLEDWVEDVQREIVKICDFLDIDYSLLVNRGEEGSNMNKNLKVERPFFSFIKNAALFKPFWRLFPTEFKAYWGLKYGMKPYVVPHPVITSETKEYIVNYIKKDSEVFLRTNGKPTTFWTFD